MASVKEIAEYVAKVASVPMDAIYAPARGRQDVSDARLVIYLIAREHTGHSAYRIGLVLNREQSSVNKGIDNLRARLKTGSPLSDLISLARVEFGIEDSLAEQRAAPPDDLLLRLAGCAA
ncbi:MAG: helix-turn-helix domain-containing protein [Pseudomonadota bacterium]